ncbi:MAG TPA: Tm-1-like ATP-binding domain-containing protein [Solirubrobacterales bacterium]|nr:Tm-1-like ATP-binding domain-containing protein [Solirubrobacterales bacterium]
MSASGNTPSGRRTVVVIGTLDTKGEELGFLRDRLAIGGVATVLVDVGILGKPAIEPDVDRHEVAAAIGLELGEAGSEERGEAVARMGEAAAATVRRLHAEGRCDGIVGAGGGGNTAIATAAMRALPLGVPKLMVSTLAGEEAGGFVGSSDITLVPSVVDVAGLNSILRPVLANAAAAMAGMLKAPPLHEPAGGPRIAATMFGVTTPCVTTARALLEERGYEVITFHATGRGGRAMEELIGDGFFAAVLDATTTELADEEVGGTLSAGPDRLTAAGAAGLPQVVSLGALDMVNFGAPETIPERFEGRLFSAHNPQATLMRTTAEECARIGADIARKLSAARGPTALFVPLRGVSALSGGGRVFDDPDADAALFAAIRENFADSVELHEIDAHINDPEFAAAMALRLADYLGKDQE